MVCGYNFSYNGLSNFAGQRASLRGLKIFLGLNHSRPKTAVELV